MSIKFNAETGCYELAEGQTLRFTKRDEAGALTVGTTNEEVIDVLIHRLREQAKKVPSRENSIAITKLEEAEMWLTRRSDRRAESKVERAAA